jgi:YggT family protein
MAIGWMLLYYTLEILKWLILARALLSWFVPPHSRNPLADGLRRLTDPVLQPIASVLPNTGGVDISPLVAFFAIILLQRLVAGMMW